jgi:hypothetical protein
VGPIPVELTETPRLFWASENAFEGLLPLEIATWGETVGEAVTCALAPGNEGLYVPDV